jgi:hypothetical protein
LIEPDSVELSEVVSPDQADRRVRLLEESPHLFESVAALRRSNEEHKTSLGIVRPKSIDKVRLIRRSDDERKEWEEKKAAVLNQERLPFEQAPLPLDFPEMKFVIDWVDNADEPHTMNLMTWGIHELYRKLSGKPDAKKKAEQAVWDKLDMTTKDVFMYLGTFHNHRRTFGLMGACSAKRLRQTSLSLD